MHGSPHWGTSWVVAVKQVQQWHTRMRCLSLPAPQGCGYRNGASGAMEVQACDGILAADICIQCVKVG